MDYHAHHISEDGFKWMPGYGYAFRDIDWIWHIFKEEPNNVRLSLEADSVNWYRDPISTYSIWHVFVINNNLPPWMEITREHVMLSLIVQVLIFKNVNII